MSVENQFGDSLCSKPKIICTQMFLKTRFIVEYEVNSWHGHRLG